MSLKRKEMWEGSVAAPPHPQSQGKVSNSKFTRGQRGLILVLKGDISA